MDMRFGCNRYVSSSCQDRVFEVTLFNIKLLNSNPEYFIKQKFIWYVDEIFFSFIPFVVY